MRPYQAMAAIAAINMGTFAYASVPVAKQCFSSLNVCYSINIPDAAASSGSGDIFFQMTGPSTYSWVGFGEGYGMSGANIFVIYASADGQNVTLSPRLGTGYVMPQYNPDAKVVLLEGSGIANGTMTANVRCSSCNSWNGGSLNYQASSSSWIYAVGSGSPLDTDDKDATISQHGNSNMGTFTWDLSTAKGGNSANPFVVQAGGNDASGSSNNNGNVTTTVSDGDSAAAYFNYVTIVHSVLASLAFVGLFPIGGILIRLGNFSKLVWVHAAVQILAFTIYIAAFGMGIWLAMQQPPDSYTHPAIGAVVFLIILSQPITGWLQHRFFSRSADRGIAAAFHLTIGRIAILLGIVNGGLGLQLAGETNDHIIAYSVVAGIMGALYIASIVFGEYRRKRARAAIGDSREQPSATNSERDSEGDLVRTEKVRTETEK